MSTARVRYRSFDTPAKSDTTWMQMCCALLVLQDPDLPAPLAELAGPDLAAWAHRGRLGS